MSFFNLRRGGQSSKPNKAKAGSNAASDSVDIIRKRAKHRLIGAAVLVLIGVIGFPLLFDSQPRPVPVDIAVDIPNKNTTRPLITPQPVPQPVTQPVLASTSEAGTPPAAVEAPVVVPPSAASPAVVAAPAARVPVAPQTDDSARARALLDGKTLSSAAASEVRMVVQVGAYAEAAKAREARSKLEKAGFKTYTQVVDTQDGQRTRVRVGPFPNRAEAEQVAGKIKALGLPVSILTL